MNHILIKFLISIFLIGCCYSVGFEEWLLNAREIIFDKNEPVKISFKANIESNSPNLLNKQNNACEIILNISEDVYQVEFEDNIIYYDKIKMDHYNANSNQFFRYKPDRVIVSFIEKITSSFLLNPSMYSSTNDSIYIYDKMTNKKDSLKMILSNDSFNVHYYSNIYNCTFSEVDFRTLDKEKYINSLIYSVADTNNIEIFNFIK
tara:strand:- start:223 stop:837 length:615 start_codon:yes stop_codon:yes gene_type:complete